MGELAKLYNVERQQLERISRDIDVARAALRDAREKFFTLIDYSDFDMSDLRMWLARAQIDAMGAAEILEFIKEERA